MAADNLAVAAFLVLASMGFTGQTKCHNRVLPDGGTCIECSGLELFGPHYGLTGATLWCSNDPNEVSNGSR